VLLLAGCVQQPFSRPYAVYDNTAPDTLRGECERAAYDDPAVKDVLARAAGSVSYAHQAWMQRLEAVKVAAVQRCMLRRGGSLGAGGVELPAR